MPKILIVDDEQGICNLIMRLINWEEIKAKLVGMENNGLDAYQAICLKKPDIVITDIRMPGLDGLGLIEKCYLMKESPRFIVISGYRDFEYAQRALKFHVEDYLLKPVEERELNMLLLKVCQQISVEQNTAKDDRDSPNCPEHQICAMRQNQMRELIHNPNAQFDTGLFENEQGSFLVLVLRVDFCERKDIERWTAVKILENISTNLCQILRENGFESTSFNEVWEQIFLLHAAKYTIKNRKKIIDLCTGVVRDSQVKYCNMSLTLAVGSDFDEGTETGRRIAQIRQYLRLWPRKLEVYVIDASDKNIKDMSVPKIEEREETLVKRISSLFFTASQEEVLYEVRSAFYSVTTDKRLLLSEKLLEQLRERIRVQELHIDNEQELIYELTDGLEHCTAREQFVDCFGSFITFLYQSKCRREREPVLQAKQYIEDHIDGQISLAETAEFVHFSPTYFSTYFREKAGIGFGDYVIKVRMEKAMYYLRESELSIYDIAEKVGYADAKHFSKVFRRVVKIKPTEYRRFYL